MSNELSSPNAGDNITAAWGQIVAARTPTGYLPFAYSLGIQPNAAPGTSTSLVAVSGGKGGCSLIPIALDAPIAMQSITVRSSDTAGARSAEMRLYWDNGTTTLQFITGTDGTLSFTPSAASDRTATVSTPGTIINPGIVWLAIRNTHATNTFGIARLADATVGMGPGSFAVTDNVPNITALGSTLATAGNFATTHTAGTFMVRLNGRVLGQTAAF